MKMIKVDPKHPKHLNLVSIGLELNLYSSVAIKGKQIKPLIKSPDNDKWERIRPETEFKAIAVALHQQKDGDEKKDKMLAGKTFARLWAETYGRNKKFDDLPSWDEMMKGIFKFLTG